jgi:hypothetical protein
MVLKVTSLGGAMAGRDLIQKIVELTGLPSEAAALELINLIKKSGRDPEMVSLSDVRTILASYMQDTLLEAKRELELNFCD